MISSFKMSPLSTETKETRAEETINDSSDFEGEKWLIRDCEIYKDEYKECTSFRGRFHQYFIFGETLDCNQWKKDFDNCCKWESDNDTKAAKAVIESEKARRMERLRAHYRNDIWKKRSGPPPDWDKPLPEWMQKKNENTYLDHKGKEYKEGTLKETSEWSCSIM